MFKQIDSKKETTTNTVTTYPSPQSICFFYPQEGDGYYSIQEAIVSEIDGEFKSSENVDAINNTFKPDSSFDVINPVTGEATGATMTEGELAAILYSLWISKRTA